MKKILVTGAKGQLGSELQVLGPNYPQFDWVFTDWEELNLCDLENLETELTKINAQIIINCAAHTAVDKAESDIDTAPFHHDRDDYFYKSLLRSAAIISACIRV